MDFCKKCGSIVLGSKGQNVKCNSCGEELLIGTEIGISGNIEQKSKIEIVDNAQKREIYPIVDKECSKCNHKKSYYWAKQTRAADEDETQFFKCEKCSHQWREY